VRFEVCLVDMEDGFLQMGKQTMGFPAQALQCRADNKMYRIQVLKRVHLWTLNSVLLCIGLFVSTCKPVFCACWRCLDVL